LGIENPLKSELRQRVALGLSKIRRTKSKEHLNISIKKGPGANQRPFHISD